MRGGAGIVAAVKSLAASERAIWIVVAAALAIRLGLIAATTDFEARFDSADFQAHASSIAAGDGFPSSHLVDGGPSAFRPPAYPYLLGGVFAVFGDSITAGRIAGALLGAVSVLLIYLIAVRFWGRGTALVAAAIAAGFPPTILSDTALLSEGLFVTAELGTLAALLMIGEGRRPLAWAALAGGLCGTAILTRSPGILLLLPALVGAYLLARDRPRPLLAPAVLLACAFLVTLPWVIRNAIEFDRPMPPSTQLGFGLVGTYNEEARTATEFRATWYGPRFFPAHVQYLQAHPGLDEGEVNEEYQDQAFDYASSHPGYVLEATGRNLMRTLAVNAEEQKRIWNWTTGHTLGERPRELTLWATRALVLVAICGIVVLALPGGPRRGPLFLWAIPVLMLLAAIPISGAPRYRVPADPFLILLAAIALVYAATELLSARRRAGPETAS